MDDFLGITRDTEAPVLVVGAASVDVVGRLRGELKMGTSNPAQIRVSFGGVARNVAENLARLGHPVRLLTVAGADPDGDRLLEQAEGAGVDTSAVMRTPNYPTGHYLGAISTRGELQAALDDMRAMAMLTAAYLEEHAAHFKEASLLFLDANLSKKSLRKAFSLARQAKLPVFADPTSVSLAPRLAPFLDRITVINPNWNEAAILCDQPPGIPCSEDALESAKRLVSLGVGLAIVTLAQLGVCYATSETSGQMPAIRTEVVDPTGAGDALSAAVIFALLNDIPLDDAIRLGVSAATLTLRHQGSVLPDLSLEKLYDQLVI